MNFSVIILILSGIICSFADVEHEVIGAVGCFESGDTKVVVMLDGDEMFFSNYEKEMVETKMPGSLSGIESPSVQYQYAKLSIRRCKERLEWGRNAVPSIPQVKDAPKSSIYTRNEVELGKNNTLICFVNGFFPPPINVNWTKNGKDVTEEAALSSYRPNTDGTFHQFSTLSFTPKDGDLYACTVKHTALEEHQTRTWETEVSESRGGPAIFCGVGLTLGLLGFSTGTFLLIKGKMKF